MLRFVCVLFDNQTNEVVPITWLNNSGTSCRWPPSSAGNVQNLAKMSAQPRSDWPYHSCRIICYESSFEKCTRTAYDIQSSGLSSADESRQETPPRKKRHESSQLEVISDDEVNFACARPQKSKCNGGGEVLDEVMSIAKENKQKLSEICFLVKSLVEAQQKSDREPPEARHILSQCGTCEEIDRWVTQSPEDVARHVIGVSLRATVRQFLKCSLTQELALTFSWSGMSRSSNTRFKTTFRDSKLHVFLLTVLKSTPFKNATYLEVASDIKVVLAGASDWDGGRKKRISMFAISVNESVSSN